MTDPFGLAAVGEGNGNSWFGSLFNAIGSALATVGMDVLKGIGYAINIPNDVIGLALGIAGLPFGGDLPTIGHNGIQFANNPLMMQNGAITFGNVMNFAQPYVDANGVSYPQGPNDPLSEGSPYTYGDHEMQHTYQGMVLGPLYLPAYGAGIIGALIQGQTGIAVMQSANFMETGPYYPQTQNLPPQPWP